MLYCNSSLYFVWDGVLCYAQYFVEHRRHIAGELKPLQTYVSTNRYGFKLPTTYCPFATSTSIYGLPLNLKSSRLIGSSRLHAWADLPLISGHEIVSGFLGVCVPENNLRGQGQAISAYNLDLQEYWIFRMRRIPDPLHIQRSMTISISQHQVCTLRKRRIERPSYAIF